MSRQHRIPEASALLSTEKFRDRFSSRPNLELLINPTDVRMHCLIADAQLLRDLFVKKALAQTVEHLLFTFREGLGWLARNFAPREGLHNLSRNMSRHRRAALAHFADGLQ